MNPGEPKLALLGQGLILLPNRSALPQRPHDTHQLMRRGHQRDLLPLRVAALDPREVRPDGRRAALRLPGGLGHQLADHRRAVARNVPEPIPVTRLVLTRDQPEIAADRLSTSKAVRIIHERGPRFGRADTHSLDAT